MINLVDVSKIYEMGGQKIFALKKINLKIAQGEFVAIMGPSGSGKSTLLNIIGLLDLPDEGNFVLFDKNITNYNEDEIANIRSQLIGFIFQQFHLLKRTTALENVSLPHLYFKSKDAQSAQHVLDIVGLGDRIEHKSNELSGGQQQRVAIARSLINSPKILFADEPTGNLDTKSEGEILNILKSLHAEGMTIIMVTHEDYIANIASRVIRLRDGQIISDTKINNTDFIHPKQEQELHLEPAKPLHFNFLIKNIEMAFTSIITNKVRSALSMLGILIGVAAVIAMLAIGRGAQESIKAEFSSLGTNLLTINPGEARFGPMRVEGGKVTRLRNSDTEEIRRRIKDIDAASSFVSGAVRAVYKDNNWSTSVSGVDTSYQIVNSVELAQGRFFTDNENKSRKRLAIIGLTVFKELFKGKSPIGEYIKLNGSRYLVIGMMKEKGSNGFRDQDDTVIIPLYTAMKRLLGKDHLDSIRVQVTNSENMEKVENELEELIIERNNLKGDDVNTFNVRNLASFQEAMTGTTKILSYLLAVIATISLVVGGIGIMNIMMVSVVERTREIGLRKAIGASRIAIKLQFLTEAVIISLCGGISGILLGLILSYGVSLIFSWPSEVTLSAAFIATSFSVTIGIIFGIWPANKASLLKPIDALRYE